MAKQIIETLIDDFDPNVGADETVNFGLDGREYEIDLSDEHADELRDALDPYVTAARKAGSNGAGPVRKPSKPEPGGKDKLGREEALAIREWVRANGGEIAGRGRIPQKYVDAYRNGDTSIFQKGDDEPEQPETGEVRELESVGAGAGDPFSTFVDHGQANG